MVTTQSFGSSGCSLVLAHQPPKPGYFAGCLVCWEGGKRASGWKTDMRKGQQTLQALIWGSSCHENQGGGLCWRPSLRRKANDKSNMSSDPGLSGLLSGCNGNRKITLEACRGVWPLLFKDRWGQRAEKQQLLEHCSTGKATPTCRENGGCSVCAQAHLRVLNTNYWHLTQKNRSQKQHSAPWVSVHWYLKVTASHK